MTPANAKTAKDQAPAPRTAAPGLVFAHLELTPDGKAQSAAIANRLGMTEIAALGRVFEWFAGQPEATYSAILRSDPKKDGDGVIARTILEAMAKPAPAPRKK